MVLSIALLHAARLSVVVVVVIAVAVAVVVVDGDGNRVVGIVGL